MKMLGSAMAVKEGGL